MKAGSGGAGRDAEDLGDLDRLEVREVTQHEKRALLRIESTEAPLELVPIGDRQEVVAAAGNVIGQDVEVGHEAALARRLVDA